MRIKLKNDATFELEYYFEIKDDGVKELLLELKNTTYENIIKNFIPENINTIEIEQINDLGDTEPYQEISKERGFFNFEKLVSVKNNIEKSTFEVIVSETTIENKIDNVSNEINNPLGLSNRVEELEKTVLQLMMMKEV